MINLEWVKDYIDISDEDIYNLAEKIKKAGINIEKVISKKIDNVVVGKVIECIKHKESDHLNICQVDVGNEILQIVCGASNVKKGIKVAVAKVGAILPDITIKPTKLAGVESNGMICGLYELGLEEKTKEAYDKGIHIINEDVEIGDNFFESLHLDDTLYELDIHKHRNNDCYSHIGFSYEISAIIKRKVQLPKIEYNSNNDDVNQMIKINIETDKCPYYLGKVALNVEVKETPNFIKRRLKSLGIKSVNNIVDISNYVMYEYGQPIHFFDYDKISKNITITTSNKQEEVELLDSNKYVIDNNDIIIKDDNNILCVAGIMGSNNSKIDNNTKNIFIESAIYDPINIRKTAQKLGVKTDSSIRFGKGLNFEYTDYAINRCCELLEKYANATIVGGEIKHDVIDKTIQSLEFTKEEVNKMLGIELTNDNIIEELERLGFNYKYENNVFKCEIPRRRLDIEPNINDIVEEIGRLYGYDNLVSTLPNTISKKGGYTKELKLNKDISKRLRSMGLNEVITYTLTPKELTNMFNYQEKEVFELPNYMSIDKSNIRVSIIPSLLNVYLYNKKRKVNDILIYEISKLYDKTKNEEVHLSMLLSGNYLSSSWNNSIEIDFYLVKGIIENLLNYLGFKNRYSYEKSSCNDLHPGISANLLLDRELIGIIGKVHPKINKDNVYVVDINVSKLLKSIKPLKYKEANKYPSIIKDMAFIMDKKMSVMEIINIMKKNGNRILQNIDIFDVYTDNNLIDQKSVAFKLEFFHEDRTLTDDEVMTTFNKICSEVVNKTSCILRDK